MALSTTLRFIPLRRSPFLSSIPVFRYIPLRRRAFLSSIPVFLLAAAAKQLHGLSPTLAAGPVAVLLASCFFVYYGIIRQTRQLEAVLQGQVAAPAPIAGGAASGVASGVANGVTRAPATGGATASASSGAVHVAASTAAGEACGGTGEAGERVGATLSGAARSASAQRAKGSPPVGPAPQAGASASTAAAMAPPPAAREMV